MITWAEFKRLVDAELTSYDLQDADISIAWIDISYTSADRIDITVEHERKQMWIAGHS